MNVKREDFLNRLAACEVGLAKREIVEHTTSFVFQNGRIRTFNTELYCQAKSPFGDEIEGAVQARPLLAVLRKLPDDEVEVTVEEGRLVVSGKGTRRLRVKMAEEILLDFDKLEKPKDWKTLPKDFTHALGMVCNCASKDEEYMKLTCVHMTPKYLEACDGHQAVRYSVKTGIAESILVRSEYVRHAAPLGMTRFCETPNWLHFKNPQGVRLSMRLFREDYKSLTSLFDIDRPTPTSLPEGLVEAVDRANELSKENADDNAVMVRIKDGRIRIVGTGQSGDYTEAPKINYDGPPVKFLIAPKLLSDLTQGYKDVEIGKGRLRVKGPKFVYSACLSPAEGDK